MKRRKFIKGSAIVGASIAGASYIGSNSGLINKKEDRKVYQILNSQRTKVGTLPIIRAFAGNHTDYVSPFVLLDEFGPVEIEKHDDPLRVDAHPHAGVIPTTYFLSGSGHHRDSLDYDFQIEKGEFMMFSSGKGAIHMEETGQKLYDEGGQYHGFQIWLNMPAEYKFIDPTTSVHQEDKMPVIKNDDYELKVVLGEMGTHKSEIKLLSPAFYYHLKIKPGGRIDIPVEATYNAFAYCINGQIETSEQLTAKQNQIVLYQREANNIPIYSEQGAELLIMGGKALDEVVYSYGPFVMNNEEQINYCLKAYHEGKMGDPDRVN